MTRPEIDQFLTCARLGRIGMTFKGGPYVVPVGYAYSDGKIFFHTCAEGLKVKALRENPSVCFEVDEALSDLSLAKSVVIFGQAEVIHDRTRTIHYLERLIDKFRVPISFGAYMKKGDRDVEKELREVKIVLVTPLQISGRSLIRTDGNF
jgi:nitroimidazol reductase NimA-like FMN-containing flavoprotein (pyridoxamine 5'-phosphate oxidase superfamily)